LLDRATGDNTQTGLVIGTPAFMAPEQVVTGRAPVDELADVWATGATMFALATGKLVHRRDNMHDLMICTATTPAPPVASVLKDAPVPIAHVIDRALALEKSKRWQSAAEMQEALREACESVFGAVPTAETIANIIEDMTEGATVVDANPPSFSDLPPRATLKLPARPVPAAAAEQSMAAVAPLTPPKRIPRTTRRSPLAMVAAGLGLVVFLARPPSRPGSAATVQARPATFAVAPAEVEPPPESSIREVRVEELPIAPALPDEPSSK
jgi:serine/threonine protein kinase